MEETVIFIPGTLCTELLWEKQIANFKEKYKVVVADVRKDNAIPDMAKRIIEENDGNFSIVGLSMGGMVALELAVTVKERVKRLALLGTNPYPPTLAQKEKFETFEKECDEGRFINIPRDRLIPNMLHSDASTETKETALRMAKDTGVEAYKRQLQALRHRIGFQDRLSEIVCPTLILCGEDDAICPPSFHEEMHGEIPQSTYELIKRCGHLSTIEQPEQVNQYLSDWLKR